MITEFSKEVKKEVGYYVYRLIDPRNGNTFYVGKGKGNRVFNHMTGALKLQGEEDEVSEKIGLIRDIHKSGLDVIHIIHRHGLTEACAKEVESALIDVYPGLTNASSGYGSDRGPMNAMQIQNTYEAEIIEDIKEKCIIIKIKQWSVDRHGGDFKNAVYAATRYAWKMSLTKAKQADYVLSVLHGIVVAVYTDLQWSYVEDRDRLMFDGEVASKEIIDKYVGKRIPQKYRRKGLASPFLYTFDT